jgi:multidrug resistance efflux pump
MSQSTTPRIVPLRRPGQTSSQPGTTAKSSGKPLLIGVVILVLGVAGLLLTQPELLKLIPPLKIGSGTDGPSTVAVIPDNEERVVCVAFVDAGSGVVPLYPLQPGRVTKVVAKEGEQVAAGAILMELDGTLARAQLAEAEADVAAGNEQIKQALLLVNQQKQMISAQQSGIEAKEFELLSVKAKLRQLDQLVKNKLAKPEELESATEMVRAGEKAVEVEQAKLRAAQTMRPEIAVEQARNDLKAREARLEKARFALDETRVKAPAAGSVLRWYVHEGETLGPAPRQPALMFCRDGKKVVRAEVEQEFAGRVHMGQKAEIRDDTTTSGPTYAGKVTRLSDWYSHRRSIILEPLQYNDVRTLECLIEIDETDKNPPLRIGQRVRVKLLGKGGT